MDQNPTPICFGWVVMAILYAHIGLVAIHSPSHFLKTIWTEFGFNLKLKQNDFRYRLPETSIKRNSAGLPKYTRLCHRNTE